jgi:hypothetical protein
MPRLLAHFRRRAKVEITCPHGRFIPGTYRLGSPVSRYGCKHCGFEVRISTHKGEVDW